MESIESDNTIARDLFDGPRIISTYSRSNVVWQTRINNNNKPIDPVENANGDLTYKVQTEKYIRYASENRPRLPRERVSDFTDWIYLLEGKSRFVERMRAGSKAEPEIFHKRFNSRLMDSLRTQPGSDWELFHCGMQTNDDIKYNKFYEIPSLRVNGNAIRGCPDLIFLSHSLQKAIIVEIKYSRAVFPNNLWPNVWAQLWAYSHIPAVQSMKDIKLIGEIWGEDGPPPYTDSLTSEIFLRASVHRDPKNAAFDRFFRSLFSIYAGNR